MRDLIREKYDNRKKSGGGVFGYILLPIFFWVRLGYARYHVYYSLRLQT